MSDPRSYPFADLALSRRLEPFEFTSVLFRPIAAGRFVALQGEPGRVSARPTRGEEAEIWADTFRRGWTEASGMSEFMQTFSRVNALKTSGRAFLAELDGRPIAAANLAVHEGVALLAGASTVPEGRRQGAQNALLEVRLRFSAESGCDLAMMCALPGSSSQRNAERHGTGFASPTPGSSGASALRILPSRHPKESSC